ncbi:helix-turn-helix domain-containing protein [Nocardioides sp. InS609-2]|uniref:helix-turn-helix domain-containing protein n=1 Tax=Nocardioides sp. InS609-2 TaxID=2760705 RepID=UPI0020BD7536|nr:helix-turn-helix domain-containing protein [Nocardioides sp. InS609-2]
MSIEAQNMVLYHSRARGTDKLLLMGIANHAGDGGAWPTIKRLVRYTNVTERAVQDALNRLVKAGELVVYLQQGGTANWKNSLRPNRYEITISCPVNCDRSPNHNLKPIAEAPADLWISPPQPTAPPAAHCTHPPQPTAPHPPQPTAPKPSIEPSTEQTTPVPTSVTGPRASALGPCDQCGLDETECMRKAHVSGHTYAPRVSGAHGKGAGYGEATATG